MSTRTRLWLCVACGLWACSGRDGEPALGQSAQQAHQSAKPVAQPAEQHAVPAPEAPAPETKAAIADPGSADDSAVWQKVTLEDQAPLCVFSDFSERGRVDFPKDVRKQTLRADAAVLFGTFAPGCIQEACDAVPMHQCHVDVDGQQPNMLVVHDRLSYKHKRGTACSKDCRSIVAGCQTPALKAGRYTVKYGERSFSLRVPSVLHSPCFKLE